MATCSVISVFAVLLVCVNGQIINSFFQVPARFGKTGGRVNFAGLTLGDVCRKIVMFGGREALSDGMGAAAKWFHNRKMTPTAAGRGDPQMSCLFSYATGGMMGMSGGQDPGNTFGDYYDTVIEYPVADPCTAPMCNGKMSPMLLLRNKYMPMMGRGMGMGGGMFGGGGMMGGMGGRMGGGMGGGGMGGGMPGMNNMMNRLTGMIGKMGGGMPMGGGMGGAGQRAAVSQAAPTMSAPTANQNLQQATQAVGGAAGGQTQQSAAPALAGLNGIPNIDGVLNLFKNPQFQKLVNQFMSTQGQVANAAPPARAAAPVAQAPAAAPRFSMGMPNMQQAMGLPQMGGMGGMAGFNPMNMFMEG